MNITTSHSMTQDATVSRFKNFEQLAKQLPLSPRKLRGLIADGAIPVIRLPGSRRLLFDWPAVEAALRRYSTPTI